MGWLWEMHVWTHVQEQMLTQKDSDQEKGKGVGETYPIGGLLRPRVTTSSSGNPWLQMEKRSK